MNEIEDIITYLPGNDIGAAYEIKQNAGLEPEYEHIKDLVPEHEPDLVEEPRVIIETQSDHHMKELIDCFVALAKDMLENGSFGNLPGDYPIKYKYKLQDACDEVEYNEGTSNRYSYLKLRQIINEMADNVIRVPLSDVTEAEELQAQFETYCKDISELGKGDIILYQVSGNYINSLERVFSINDMDYSTYLSNMGSYYTSGSRSSYPETMGASFKLMYGKVTGLNKDVIKFQNVPDGDSNARFPMHIQYNKMSALFII